MKHKVIPFFKELGRLLIFSLPALAIQIITQDPELSVYGGGIILYVLRGLDKAIHENPNTNKTGLIPF